MEFRSFVPAILFGAVLASSSRAADTLTITKMDDTHIVNAKGITYGIPNPNNGNSKLLAISGFKC